MNTITFNDKQITISEGNLQDFNNFYSDSALLKNEFMSMVANGVLVPFFATCDGKMVGKIYFVKQLSDKEVADGKNIGYIFNLYVVKPYRKHGIGTALVNYVKEYAKRNYFKKLCLGVEEEEVQNVRLYSKLLFVEKIKDTNKDMLFKDENSKPLEVRPYIIISCTISD